MPRGTPRRSPPSDAAMRVTALRIKARKAATAAAMMVCGLAGPVAAAEWPERLSGHGGPVKSVVIASDGQRALTASFDYAAILWRLADGKAEIEQRLIGHDAAVNDIRFLPPDLAVSVGDDGAVLLWDLDTGESLDRQNPSDAKILSVSVSADGRYAAVASWDRTARVFEVAQRKLIPKAVLSGHANTVNAVAFSPDAETVYTASSDGAIRAFSLADGSLERVVYDHGWGVNVLRVINEGAAIAFGATDGAVAIIDTDTGEIAKQLISHERPVLSLTASHDDSRLASGGGDGRIHVYDADGWSVLESFQNPYGPVWGMAFTPDRTVAYYAGLDDHVNRWQISPRKPFEPVPSAFPRRFQAAAEGDLGARQFARKCSVCHTLTPDDANRAGPTLYGVFGRRVGSLPGYPYSQALRDLDFVWTEETISDLFHLGPDIVTPGTKMPIQRLQSDEERAALVAFLKRATAPGASLEKPEEETVQ